MSELFLEIIPNFWQIIKNICRDTFCVIFEFAGIHSKRSTIRPNSKQKRISSGLINHFSLFVPREICCLIFYCSIIFSSHSFFFFLGLSNQISYFQWFLTILCFCFAFSTKFNFDFMSYYLTVEVENKNKQNVEKPPKQAACCCSGGEQKKHLMLS